MVEFQQHAGRQVMGFNGIQLLALVIAGAVLFLYATGKLK
jgi:hypothetical protein